MRNQPRNPVFDDSPSAVIAPGSALRFRLLNVVFLLGASAVLARAAWIQGTLREKYLQALEVTTVDYELIPARDGRILAGGTVLAADQDLYTIEVHYRWLEDPPDEQWLARTVRSQLTPSERSDRQIVADLRQRQLRRRTQLWQELARLTSISQQDLQERRHEIQRRVQRIAADVNRRHRRRQTDHMRPSDPAADEAAHPLLRLASAVRRLVTAVPEPAVPDRIVVREEEDYHPVVERVSLSVAAAIRSHPERFPGVRVRLTTHRTYPQGQLACHVVGARTSLKPEERRKLNDAWQAALKDWIPRRGRTGVEFSWDFRLRGSPGLRRIVRNRRQQIIESTVIHAPRAGRDVFLTIIPSLQQHAEHLLSSALRSPAADIPPDAAGHRPEPAGGCIIVMDVRDGHILTAASAPAFDLRMFVNGRPEEWNAVNADPRHPFLSRMVSAVLPPGSVFKPVTAAAALEHGLMQPETRFSCQGYLERPDEYRCLIYRRYGTGHGPITLAGALARSCNVYFFDVARRSGLRPLTDWARRFGFGVPTGVDLPFERSGHVPDSADRLQSGESSALNPDAAGLAVGQASLTVTPMQIVRMMAAIANDGWLVVPHVASLEGTARRTDEAQISPRSLVRRRVPGLHRETLQAIRRGLEDTVRQPWGTAYDTVRTDETDIAGKTGTAETGTNRPDHAWFAGYVPTDQPRFAFVVVLEHGGSGSQAAGNVARELVRGLMSAVRLSD